MMETPPIATKAEERLFDSMARIWGNASKSTSWKPRYGMGEDVIGRKRLKTGRKDPKDKTIDERISTSTSTIRTTL